MDENTPPSGFSEILNDLQNLPWRKHAENLGIISILWTRLELQLDILLVGLMTGTDETIQSVFLGSQSMRDKCNSAKVLGLHRKVSEQWYDQLTNLLNKIDNEMRPNRNRLTHDYWLASSKPTDDMVKLNHQPKVVRPQSRTYAIKYHDAEEVSISRLVVFQIQILSAIGELMSLIGGLYSSDADVEKVESNSESESNSSQ
ncbi:MAG: hypothetical protein IE925_01440 [Rhodobacterales bacterium]|nr:hypothetical protein [Rhodobacterales bacterium]